MKLAGRSTKAAQETANLIQSSYKKVENGMGTMNQTAKALSEIVDGVTKAADLIGEITISSNEQAQGISQVNQGLNQIQQVTQQNTGNAEQIASSAETLSAFATQLRTLVDHFKLPEKYTNDSPIKQDNDQKAGFELAHIS